MVIIVGLGNPGEKYKNTRHNTGFLVLDKLKNKIPKSKIQITNKSKIPNFKFQKKYKAEICRLNNLLLVKPQTYMNSSGEAVKATSQYLNILISQYLNDLYIIHDELDLALGEYKIQFGRGAAGHKGVNSVIEQLGTNQFWRVRIGIGPNDKPSEEFVLEKFKPEERQVLDKVVEEVIEELMDKIRQ